MITEVLPGQLYRSARPGYDRGRPTPVGSGKIQTWIDAAQSAGVKSIVCLLSDEHLRLYPDSALVEIYRAAGFEVRHVPVTDHRQPTLTTEELEAVLVAYRELPKPVLVHCSAGIDRTGAAIACITEADS
jgi:protein tyrosine/serine phosphatase